MTATRPSGPVLALGEAARVMVLPATVQSPAAARAFARDMLDEWRAAASDEVVLVVNELVTNAVVHARGALTLSLGLRDGAIRIVVGDDSTALPTRNEGDITAEQGRGLALVAAISLSWGVEERDGGKTVWADVPTDPGAVPEDGQR